MRANCGLGLLAAGLLLSLCGALAEDLPALCADRAAVERVYYSHQIGNKPPFDQTFPPSLIERLVKTDVHKQAVLQRVYGVKVTPAMVAAETQRINTTTRAPNVLAELKAALGNDTNRFARTVIEPILVERLLREKFESDGSLHTAPRRETESVRARLLAAKKDGATVTNMLALLEEGHAKDVSKAAWELGPRPPQTQPPGTDEIEIKKRFGPDAQIISPPRSADGAQKHYFEDLPPELQRVLRLQLRQAGDVSAVLEVSGGFMLYLCTGKSADGLATAELALRKRDYDEWLNQQTQTAP